MGSFRIHMRAILQEIIFDVRLEITNLRLQSNLLGTNEWMIIWIMVALKWFAE